MNGSYFKPVKYITYHLFKRSKLVRLKMKYMNVFVFFYKARRIKFAFVFSMSIKRYIIAIFDMMLWIKQQLLCQSNITLIFNFLAGVFQFRSDLLAKYEQKKIRTPLKIVTHTHIVLLILTWVLDWARTWQRFPDRFCFFKRQTHPWPYCPDH